MKRLVVGACIVLGAALGTLAGSTSSPVTTAHDPRAAQLRVDVDRIRVRFADVKRDLDAATTHDAATAARAKLFQLRVDMVALEDEIVAKLQSNAAERVDGSWESREKPSR